MRAFDAENNSEHLVELTPSDRVQAALGEKATTAIRAAFGDVAVFNQLVERIEGIRHPNPENVREIQAYFNHMTFSEYPENQVMLGRLEAIVRGELTPEQVDINFMQHELLEHALVEQGIVKGYIEIPSTSLVWDAAHDITSQALGVEHASHLYHPDALQAAEESLGELEI